MAALKIVNLAQNTDLDEPKHVGCVLDAVEDMVLSFDVKDTATDTITLNIDDRLLVYIFVMVSFWVAVSAPDWLSAFAAYCAAFFGGVGLVFLKILKGVFK